MFVSPEDTHVRGKLSVLKTKEKEIMNVIFEHMLRYKSKMEKCIYMIRFVSPFSSLSHGEIVAEYEEILDKYKQKE